MILRDALKKAVELNRQEVARGSSKRYVVVGDPVGSCDGRHQLVERRVDAAGRHSAVAR